MDKVSGTVFSARVRNDEVRKVARIRFQRYDRPRYDFGPMTDTSRFILDPIGDSEDGFRYNGPIANSYYWQADHGRLAEKVPLDSRP